MTLLAVHGLTIARPDGGAVVRGASLTLEAGESLGIAGESGCGKSTLLLALMAILKPGLSVTSGRVELDGQDLTQAPAESLRRLRGRTVALVPQSAPLALAPTMRIGAQLAEAMAVHRALPPEGIPARVTELLARVRLPEPDRIARRFPHELSGGQMQRVAIAMALASRPRLLLLDEPTTGLDVTTQAAILDLIDGLRRETGVAIVCVSHDLGVLARLTGRMAVMYAGAIVEDRPAADLLARPAHPYSRALLASVPRLGTPGLPPAIPGRPPAPGAGGPGCAFQPRCAVALAACAASPALSALPGSGRIACHAPQGGPLPLPVLTAAEGSAAAGPALVAVQDLTVQYRRPTLLSRLGRRPAAPPVVDGVSLSLARGEILGLVGQSGSGKSTILRAIAGLWPRSGGAVTLDGTTLPARVTGRDRTSLRRMQVVFQNPDASLNPRHSLREILAQPLRLYFGAGPAQVEERARALLADVRLDPAYLDRRPAQLSGGERQRVALARAFAAEPDVILCDEVTSALDVSVQASVLALIRDLCRGKGTACLFVAHDLAVVTALCDRVAVLHEGRIVEEGPARHLALAPAHDYTRSLIAAARAGEARADMPTPLAAPA
jgi:peptide/nickel transport system ATP-binding protein